jgi:hypothetical protein
VHHIERVTAWRTYAQADALYVEQIYQPTQRVLDGGPDLIRVQAEEGRRRYAGELIELCEHVVSPD